ncbi:hypothetical protein [Natrinema sp. 1APR25-10V2]|uniref:hypothetical protein n=1 Tax=Natrinema sp. 1APR25-10V2 TaxID=2951081 RepID=UPI002875D5C1|nr:hypothetical protein [Natrinema sp. 1APR25-10V2]MDS0476350.1 hypothetical protein [Natrinema sp. 1APR25-10V2]
MTTPTPPNAVPDFMLEQFAELSPETLRGVGDYARTDTYVAPDGMPDSLKESFALQNDETLAAIADYVDELAAFLEEREADSLAAITDTGDDEEKWGHKKILEWHGG